MHKKDIYGDFQKLKWGFWTLKTWEVRFQAKFKQISKVQGVPADLGSSWHVTQRKPGPHSASRRVTGLVAAIIKSVDNCLLKLGPKITSFQHLMKVSFSNIRKLWMYNPPNARTHTRARMYVPSLKTKSGSNNHIHTYMASHWLFFEKQYFGISAECFWGNLLGENYTIQFWSYIFHRKFYFPSQVKRSGRNITLFTWHDQKFI